MPGRLVGPLLLLALVVVAPASAQRRDTLPSVVATAFRATYPAAKILHVSREEQEGKTVYEIESQDGSMRRDLLYRPDGQVLEIEEMIPADSVPAAVQSAVQRDHPGATLGGAERVKRGDVVLYEVSARKNGRTLHLTYDPDGVLKE